MKKLIALCLMLVSMSCAPRVTGYVNHDYNGRDLPAAKYPRAGINLPLIHLQIVRR